jgi:hypothetical protein
MPRERKKKKPPYSYVVSQVAALRAIEEKGELDEESYSKHYMSLRLSKHSLEEKRQSFNETKNPLYIWSAYLLCREFDKPWPDYVKEYMDWIMEYFEEVAKGLLNTKNNLSDCALHLGFELKDGGPSQFKQYEKQEDMTYVLGEVIHRLNMNEFKSVEKACAKISEEFEEIHKESISEAKIKDWYLKKR